MNIDKTVKKYVGNPKKTKVSAMHILGTPGIILSMMAEREAFLPY
jgi:hypothetical protein